MFCSPHLYLRPRTDNTLPRGTGGWWQASLNKDLSPGAATEAQLSAAAFNTRSGAGGSRTACAPRPRTAALRAPSGAAAVEQGRRCPPGATGTSVKTHHGVLQQVLQPCQARVVVARILPFDGVLQVAQVRLRLPGIAEELKSQRASQKPAQLSPAISNPQLHRRPPQIPSEQHPAAALRHCRSSEHPTQMDRTSQKLRPLAQVRYLFPESSLKERDGSEEGALMSPATSCFSLPQRDTKHGADVPGRSSCSIAARSCRRVCSPLKPGEFGAPLLRTWK